MGADLGWWSISGDDLLAMLRRAHAGEDPDALYAEHYANADHERPQSTGLPGWVAQAGVGIIVAVAALTRALLVFAGAQAVRTQNVGDFVVTIGFAALSLHMDREARHAWR